MQQTETSLQIIYVYQLVSVYIQNRAGCGLWAWLSISELHPPVVFEESSRHSYEGEEEIDREGVFSPPVTRELKEVEEEDGETNDQGLPHFNPVNAGQDVDGIRAEDSEHTHVHKVQYA